MIGILFLGFKEILDALNLNFTIRCKELIILLFNGIDPNTSHTSIFCTSALLHVPLSMPKRIHFFIWLIPSCAFLALLLALRLYDGKIASFLFLQKNSFFRLDVWKFITYLGDGIAAAVLVAFLIIKKNKELALKILLVWLIGAGIAQGLKNTIYAQRLRPVEWFKQKNLPLAIPDGHEPHRTHSFPSGHTTTAFGIWGMMAFYTHRKRYALAFAFLAILAAWSRIALFQHFPADVVAGGLIGTCSIFAAIGLARWLEQKYPQLRNYR